MLLNSLLVSYFLTFPSMRYYNFFDFNPMCFSSNSDWISQQPWSNGSVGMFGKSWGGFNGLQVAFCQPKALKAVITLYSTGGILKNQKTKII